MTPQAPPVPRGWLARFDAQERAVLLPLVGGLAHVLEPAAVVLLLAAADARGILLLRGLPETAGVDVTGPRPVPGGAA